MAKKKIRFVGLLLAAVMVLSMGAVSVAAEDTADAAAADSITLTDLAAKLNANDGKVTLDKNVVVKEDETAQVKGIKNIVIDLGGKTLDATNCASRALPIVGADTVKITNGTVKAGTTKGNMLFVFRGTNKPTVTVEDVVIDFSAVTDTGAAYTDLFGFGSGVTPIFNNCTILVNSTKQLNLVEYFRNKAGIDSLKIVLENDLSGTENVIGKVYKNVEIDLNKNTLSVENDGSTRTIPVYADKVVVKNGTVKLASATGAMIVVDRDTSNTTCNVVYENVNFDFSNAENSFNMLSNKNATVDSKCTMTVADLTQWKTAQKFAAKYTPNTFNVALANDITGSDQLAVKGFDNVVIDLNNHTLKSASGDDAYRMMPITGAGNVTVKNGTISLNDTAKAGSMMFVFRNTNPDVSIEGVKIVRNEINTVKLFYGAKDVSYKAGCEVKTLINENSNMTLSAQAKDGYIVAEISNFNISEADVSNGNIKTAGIVYSISKSYNIGDADSKLRIGKNAKVRVSNVAEGSFKNLTDTNAKLTLNIHSDEDHADNTIWARAYVELTNGTIIYSDVVMSSYNSLGN